jgi:hypothetical protein
MSNGMVTSAVITPGELPVCSVRCRLQLQPLSRCLLPTSPDVWKHPRPQTWPVRHVRAAFIAIVVETESSMCCSQHQVVNTCGAMEAWLHTFYDELLQLNGL